MKLLSAVIATALTSIANAVPVDNVAPIANVQPYTYPLRQPKPEFSIKVPSQLQITMCQDYNFGHPCVSGYVAPGLCYGTPDFGVTSVRPGEEASGCTLYEGVTCEPDSKHVSDVAPPNGVSNLGDYGLNDLVHSFICY